jgi:cytochrome b561
MTKRYTRTAAILHWLIAALLVFNIGLALLSKDLEGPVRQNVLDLHKSLGITILGLAVIRLTWRWLHIPPPFPRAYSKLEQRTAFSVHALLYFVMISLPFSGWTRDSAWVLARSNPMKLFTIIPWPRFSFIMDLDPGTKEAVHTYAGAAHTSLAYSLYALLLLHIAGALKHQFVDEEPAIQRILPS